jgi:hypothetical protein
MYLMGGTEKYISSVLSKVGGQLCKNHRPLKMQSANTKE